jgi:hypothetical protein
LEDDGQYADSFRQYAQGKALRRKAVPYDVRAAEENLRRLKLACTPELFRSHSGAGCGSRDPIFIVGVTRAGSTLVEQILASHPMVEGTKELRLVASLIATLDRRETQPPLAYPEILQKLPHGEFQHLGEKYLEAAQAYRRLERPFFTDKTPENFQHLGLIHLMLPNAKIIDARRHPLGCGFANFRQYYHYGQTFASDLSDIGHYYRAYVELMAHFDSMLPGAVHRVLYEDLVTNPVAEIRRLLDYCGLPFEERCLRFYETERAVLTPSSEQVRRPLFTDAIEQWQHYESWLGALKASLGDVLDRYPAVPDFAERAFASGMQWGSPGAYRWISTPQRPNGS